MGFARAANVPVMLIGDIERGGVIASLVGTHAVLPADDAAMIEGFLVNRFRGDPALFATGMAEIARRTGWASLGLIPFFTERASAAGGRCARARWRSAGQARREAAHRRADPAAHLEFRRPRPAGCRTLH